MGYSVKRISHVVCSAETGFTWMNAAEAAVLMLSQKFTRKLEKNITYA